MFACVEKQELGLQGDIVAMTCMASANRDGVLGSERVCLCTEGFGNRMCSLENVSDRVIPWRFPYCIEHITFHMIFWYFEAVRLTYSTMLSSQRLFQDLPPDISMCMLHIDNALSVRALQEMMSNDKELVSFLVYHI